jgi:paraquat-inducible protein B
LGIGSPLYFPSPAGRPGHCLQARRRRRLRPFQVFVNAPYDRFVSAETRFWNASGLDVSLGADGVDVRTQSLVSLLIGGVAFETPTFVARASPPPPTAPSPCLRTGPPR